ncbi:MAG: DUF192 domain-containing protein [Firmicutes bacterium]|nr:DUF192 domain-containing protein [Bacillota bacterium]
MAGRSWVSTSPAVLRLWDASRQVMVAARIRKADTFRARLQGLLGCPPLPPGAGLVLVPCRAVHTFFMAYPIDVVFLDPAGRVLRCLTDLAPFRLPAPVWQARVAVELPAGTLRKAGVRPGHRLTFLPPVEGLP